MKGIGACFWLAHLLLPLKAHKHHLVGLIPHYITQARMLLQTGNEEIDTEDWERWRVCLPKHGDAASRSLET